MDKQVIIMKSPNYLICVLALSVILSDVLIAQLCPFGVGINAIHDGDFGSGSRNLLLGDPNIAPGYIYSTTAPPADGYYVIANNTTDWGDFAADAWINIGDNSTDPNGYMMVVNASYDPGAFFRRRLDVCAASTYEFSVDVINLIKPESNLQIQPQLEFLVDNQVYYTSDLLPQDSTWYTFGFSFMTGDMTESVLLEIRNLAPGGLGNDLALDNLQFAICGPNLELHSSGLACDNDPLIIEVTMSGGSFDQPQYQWLYSPDARIWENIDGAIASTYSTVDADPGHYRVMVSEFGNIESLSCRLLSPTVLVHPAPSLDTTHIMMTSCSLPQVQVMDSVITTFGHHLIHGLSRRGCDSIVVLSIDQEGNDYVLIEDSICAGESYQGVMHTTPFHRLDTTIDGSGCIHVQELMLWVGNPKIDHLRETYYLVEGEAVSIAPVIGSSGLSYTLDWTWEGVILCHDCPVFEFYPEQSGTLTVHVTTAQGCQSSKSTQIVVTYDYGSIYLPTAFSPNNDGINDIFYPLSERSQPIRSLRIYDRWGKTLYERTNFSSNDAAIGWDGTFNGKVVDNQIYVWHIVFDDIFGQPVQEKGEVQVIR